MKENIKKFYVGNHGDFDHIVHSVLIELSKIYDIKYSVDGGYDNAERKVIFIYPYYMEYEDIECPLEIVQVEGNFKFKEISHKDYLGAILNLGIVREKIGDIIIHENFCQVVVTSGICDFLTINLNKVSRNKVIVKKISRDDIIPNSPNYKDISFTVSSQRLDCIISHPQIPADGTQQCVT